MEKIKIKIVAEHMDFIPHYETKGSAGADIKAFLPDGTVTIYAGQWKLIDSGFSCAIEEGYEMQIRPRSGNAVKKGLTVLNTPGTVDEDYRGRVKVILMNVSEEKIDITHKMKIAQAVFNKVPRGEFEVVTSLDSTERGDGGFGHTGD